MCSSLSWFSVSEKSRKKWWNQVFPTNGTRHEFSCIPNDFLLDAVGMAHAKVITCLIFRRKSWFGGQKVDREMMSTEQFPIPLFLKKEKTIHFFILEQFAKPFSILEQFPINPFALIQFPRHFSIWEEFLIHPFIKNQFPLHSFIYE